LCPRGRESGAPGGGACLQSGANRRSDMLKVLGIAIVVIFLIGLLVVIGAFDLIL
jgi:hypothetical protein